MTSTELEAIFRKIELQKLSDEELSSILSLLNLKTSEIKWILNGRKIHRSHFPKKK